MKVSVIIPVYNVRPYLERCIQSVLCQTYKDLEIILVDDGSTDGSGQLSDQISHTDRRVRVVHKKNQGLSAARNTGIQEATGDYIIFLDSDDEWLLPNGLEKLLQEYERNRPDIVIFKRLDIWADGVRTLAPDYDVSNITQIPDGCSVFKYLIATQQFQMSACFLLVRRQILIDYNILFPLGYISEDVYWSLHLWQHVNNVAVLNLNFYGYHHREASLSTTTSIRVYESFDKIFSYWKEQCDRNCKNADAIRAYLANMWVSRGYAYHSLADHDKPEALDILQKHSDLLTYCFSPRTKRTRRMVQVVGVKATVNLLGWYWKLRSYVTH